MCVGIPGEVVGITEKLGFLQGIVSFGGIKKEVSLMCTPEVKLGEYVLVHVGVAISVIDKVEAERIYSYLDEINELQN